MPLSARTMAPASKAYSFVSCSFLTAAVSPTLDVPLPVVVTHKGDNY